MSQVQLDPPHFERLFKRKEGPVQVELWGPKIGWQFGVLKVFRWEQSTRIPGGWQKAMLKRQDIQNLKRCIDALASWQKLVDENRLRPYRRPRNV